MPCVIAILLFDLHRFVFSLFYIKKRKKNDPNQTEQHT